MKSIDRRDFMKLAGLGGVVFASGLGFPVFGSKEGKSIVQDDFHFVQFSDTHWGFNGAAINPDAQGTLKKAVAAVNSLEEQPDFVVFTGDLTHTTDDPKMRRERLKGFQDVVSGLRAKTVYFMAGEHDAALDKGEAFQERFGKLNYTFDHKGVHFIVLDNASDPAGLLGETQLKWLQDNLKKRHANAPIVVLTHRPLFDLYPQWDWATRDGASAIKALMPFQNVTVFYGHIHQEHHHMTGHIAHHAAKSLMFPLAAPGAVPKRAPIAWDTNAPYQGLGFRDIEAYIKKSRYEIHELPVVKG
ncbi:MAG: metallophosphoesterase [Acidobacteria bacterium]|nr:metallophosphoesterase [Acidobacteriota bacterium]